jgi:hypothetical protein
MQRLGLLMGVLFCSRIDAPKRSGGKKSPSLVGYEHDLRDCRRVGLITRCETAAQLHAAEIRFVR